jgi:transcriptional regulator with XRE-family HTH domain
MKSNKLTNQAVNNLIGKNLRKVRDAKGKSRREVSEKLGVSAKSLEQWEKGIMQIKLSWLIFIADILGVCVTDLIPTQREINKLLHEV